MRDKLVPKLFRFLRPAETAGETVAFGNNAENGEERVADQFFLCSSEKSLAGEIDARKPAREILSEDHVGGMLDHVSIARFETRAFEQARYFRYEPSGVKRKLQII